MIDMLSGTADGNVVRYTDDGHTARIFSIHTSDIARCPKRSFAAEHYDDDGTCRCDEEREERTALPVACSTQDLRDGRILGRATTAVGALRHASRLHLLNPRREYVTVKLVDVPDFISATDQAERYWQIGVHLKEHN